MQTVIYLMEVTTVAREVRTWDNEELKKAVHIDPRWAKGFAGKSTRGGMMMISGTVVKHLSRTHATRAMSVAESEYHAIVTSTAEVLGMQACLSDVGGCRPRSERGWIPTRQKQQPPEGAWEKRRTCR